MQDTQGEATTTSRARSARSDVSRRSSKSHAAIVEATNELVSEVGYGALTIEGVAARAGVGKATVYRWWPSKGALVLDALGARDSSVRIVDTGDVRGDLIRAARQLIDMFTATSEGSIIAAMTADLVRDPDLAELFRAGLLRPRRSLIAEVIERAVERGELAADLDIPLFLDACVGAVFYRTVVSGEPITAPLAEHLVDLLLAGARG
jgi:AcrR family transcriptional regulator